MRINRRNTSLLLLFLILTNIYIPFASYNGENIDEADELTPFDPFSDYLPTSLEDGDPIYPSDIDIGNILADNEHDFNEIFEPWKSKAAIHAIAYDEETGILALGGGYLYDNEVHVFRLNTETGEFDKVWDMGGDIIQSDILSLDIGDTDLNNFIEIVAGSADGHVYVFEQRHIYDPITNTENMFDLVWTSPSMFRVFDIKIEDVDLDYRPDIIVGSWDGLFLFEYDTHSGYPFVEDHWINYRQVWKSSDFEEDQKIYSLEAGDTNENGLPEIIVGTREGTVYVYENDGTTVWINDEPFPLINDNNYVLNWTSEAYTRMPIISMDIGELDGTPGDEIALISQGEGVFVLDWDDSAQSYNYQKVVKDFEAWETFGYWGLDSYADSVLSATNVTYHDLYNTTLIVDEPINYEWNGTAFVPDTLIYPYNTGMAGASDGNYTIFNSSSLDVDYSTAIIDFGADEEGTGSASPIFDVIIDFKNTVGLEIYNELNISISRDGYDFEQIDNNDIVRNADTLEIDVDNALIARNWNYFRYIKITVYNGGEYQIDSLELCQVYNLLTDALSLTIGPLNTNGTAYVKGITEADKILIGTVTGKYIAASWNASESKYQVNWDSMNDDYYSEDTGIWDIEHIPTTADVPIWRFLQSTASEPMGHPELDPGENNGIYQYNSWTAGKLNYNFIPSTPITSPTDTYYLMGTKNSAIQIYDSFGNFDSVNYAYLNQINTWLLSENKPYTSVEVLDMYDPTYSLLPLLVVSSYNPNQIPSGNIFGSPTATIDFWYRESFDLTADYSARIKMETLDETGEINSLLSVSTTTPKTDFADYDNDGDMDMVFTNGFIYLAKNLDVEKGSSFGDMKFVLVRDYFREVNEIISGNGGQPDLFDIDLDGDLDLILNYAEKNGTTCFINKGTADSPKWIQEKSIFSNSRPETNMNYLGYTDTRIIESYMDNTLDIFSDLYSYDIEDYSMVTFDLNTNRTIWSEPVYDVMNSYLVATYPEVLRKEFCLLDDSSSKFQNVGFHVRQSWSTEDDLNGWTLSISSGDLDNDGKGEIIVGDYDNNVYVFENLVNNTYKRMYQTFDLTHNEVATESPYLYDDLQGISGEFTRIIWDHAKHLKTDVDLDQDGLQELIVSADLQLYIFEDMNLTGGDQMEFIYSIDLREGEFVGEAGWDQVKEITAIEAGIDLDNDGNMELAIAAGPYLHVYNVPIGSFVGMENTDYFATNPEIEGRYDLIGNPLSDEDREYAIINALAMGDTDQDGYKELIIGGINDSRAMIESGFTFIYEIQGGTFRNVWQPSDNHTFWNPVNIIMIDDQDYDGFEEIIIGHTQGVDIWEWSGLDSEYNNVEYITSFPNYPIINLDDTQGFVSIDDDNTRPGNSLANYEDGNTIMHVFTNKSGSYDYLNYRIYDKSSGSWSNGQRLYTGVYLTRGTLRGEIQPKVTCTKDGDYYAIWNIVNSFGENELWMAEYNGASWNTPQLVRSYANGNLRKYPDIFEYSTTEIGILYTFNEATMAFCVTPKSSFGTWGSFTTMNFENYLEYKVHSSSIDTLPTGDFAISFAAINQATTKPDYDIYTLYLNSSFSYSGVSPVQSTTSYIDELLPDVSHMYTDDESDNNAIIVTYENVNSQFEEKIGIVASDDKGKNWGRQNTLNTILPKFIRNENMEDNYISWQYNLTGSIVAMLGPMALSPCIIGLEDEGFMYAFTATTNSFPLSWWDGDTHYWLGIPVYGINPQSDWIGNTLLDVVDLDVGDTDGDNRNEIVVGWDNQVGVYELKSSLDVNAMMVYEEAWLSDQFTNSFTGVTVYDSNGNGWDEIGIATERGDVYLLETRDPSIGVTKFVSSTTDWNKSLYLQSSIELFESYDVDGDLLDEIIVGSNLFIEYGVYAVDDDGSSLVWYNIDNFGDLRYMELKDITNDDIPEILITTWDEYAYALNITDGTQLWNYYSGTSDNLHEIDAADIENDGFIEIIIGVENGTILILDNDGEYLTQMDHPTGGRISSLALGNFTGGDQLSLAYIDTDEKLSVYYPLNDSLIYESITGIAGKTSTADVVPFDFNDDGIDEVVFGKLGIRILDVNNGEIYYNSTEYGTLIGDIFIEDFDGDGEFEILATTSDNGVFLEDIKTRQTQWHYNANLSESTIRDIDIGNFGGNGDLDLCIASSKSGIGFIVAIDGQNGVPVWFNQFDEGLYTIKAVNLTGSSEHKVGALSANYLTGLMIFEHDTNPIYPEIESFGYKESYMTWEHSKGAIIGIWVYDIDQDNIDDVIIQLDDFTLILINMASESEEWAYRLNDAIEILKVGNLNGEGDLDLVVYPDNEKITIIEGANGNTLKEYTPPEGYYPKFIEVANFTSYADQDYVDEIAMLLAIKVPDPTPYHYIKWINHKGNTLFDAEYIQGEIINDMVIGDFYENGRVDVAIAGETYNLEIYDGEDGTRVMGPYNPGEIIVKLLKSNDLDETGNDDIVMELADGSIVLMSCDGGSLSYMYTIDFGEGSIRDYKSADLLNTGHDQLILDVFGQGIKLYEKSGFTGSQYNLGENLILGRETSSIVLGHLKSESLNEIVVTNYNYIQHLNSTSSYVDWIHKSREQIEYAQIGTFNDKAGSIVYLNEGKVEFVFGIDKKPPSPFDPFDNPIIDQKKSFILIIGIVGSVIAASITIGVLIKKKIKVPSDKISCDLIPN